MLRAHFNHHVFEQGQQSKCEEPGGTEKWNQNVDWLKIAMLSLLLLS